MKRVVITGIAPISSIGIGKNDFFENIFKKKIEVKRIPDGYCKNYIPESKWMVPYPGIDYNKYGIEIQKMSGRAPLNAIIAAVSALLALEDADIKTPDQNTAVVMGVGVSNMEDILTAVEAVTENKKMYPLTIPMIMTNAVSCWISIVLGIHGNNSVVSNACASGTVAVGEAYRLIANGYNQVAICGGADCVTQDKGMILRGFDLLGALTKTEDGLPYAFSEERSGFLFSEGAACTLILEEYEHAKNRNAEIYAEITGYESSCDGYHIVMMPKNPIEARNIIESLCKDEHVDYYNAHGTGTEMNDMTERTIIQDIWGAEAKQPYINSTKGIIGHSIGASGAIEAAVCAYAVKNNMIHGNILKTPMSGLKLPESTVMTDVNCAISASFGFGGHNAALKFKKCIT